MVACCQTYPVTRSVPYTCTIMVPQVQTRTESYCVSVPVMRQVVENYQVQVPVYRTVQTQYTVCVPVWTNQVQQYTVMVPACETRQGMRCETHCVPVVQTCTHCVDRGHWEERPLPSCCNCCGPCQQTQCVALLGA